VLRPANLSFVARPRSVRLDQERLWGAKTSRERGSAMLTPCLTFSGSCSQPSKPRCAHARIWCSRTYCYAINSRCSPGPLALDRVLGCTCGTSCWAADLLSVPTLTFKTLHVLVFIAHGRRELVHVNVTANPTAAWVWRQLIEATPWGYKPRHLLRDRDAVYGREFRQRASRIGIDAIATPIHAPKANAIAGE
jgi:transposase InsO family protein